MESLVVRCAALAAALLLALPAAGLFAQPRAPQRDPVERDLGGDLFIAGSTVSVNSPVAGDLFAAGGNIDVSAEVGGDVAVAGGNVRLGGPIRHNLYAAGGRVALDGSVGRNVRAAAGRLEIGPRAKVAGNLTVAGGDVRLRGADDGHLLIAGGHVLIDGVVGGNVEVGSGEVELGPAARIKGRLRYASRDELRRDGSAEVVGGIERFTPRAAWPVPTQVQERAGRGAGWVWSAGLVAIAALLVAALPGAYTGVAATVRARWAFSLLIGFIWLVCLPVAALIAMLTIVGVPLALVALALYLALLLVGYVSAGIALGEIALGRIAAAHSQRTGWRVAAGACGMLGISLLGRLPWIGGALVFAAMLLGIGALLMQLAPNSPPRAISPAPAR